MLGWRKSAATRIGGKTKHTTRQNLYSRRRSSGVLVVQEEAVGKEGGAIMGDERWI
jgi:hypothetical protein